ncbi:hypothetical protein BsWGS_24987 [Bradybaena similaris]
MSEKTSPVTGWVAACIGLGAIATGLLGVVIHLKTTEPSCVVKPEKIPLIDVYKYFFTTKHEQREYENKLSNDIVYNACCISNRGFKRLDKVLTLREEEVTVIQNISGSFQTFYVEDCTPASRNCTCNCGCQKQYGYVFAAVYYPPKSTNMTFMTIKYKAICKCINGYS